MVTSDTFERAIRYRDSYDRSRGEPIAWLIGIARRCVDDLLAARRPTVADPPDVSDEGDLEDETVGRLAIGFEVARLAPEKHAGRIEGAIRTLKTDITDGADEKARYKSAPNFAPADQ